MHIYDATETAYKNGYAAAAREILTWIEENGVNLNFVTGNFELNLGMYLELRKKYLPENDDAKIR